MGKVGEETHEKPRSRWKNITLDLKKIGWETRDWIDLAQDGAKWLIVVNVWVLHNAGNLLTS
jgi:hypothetical protein